MNGQEQKLINKMHSDLSHAMVELRTRFEERGDAHDKRAIDIKERMDDNFKKVFEWLEWLPCKERGWLTKAVMGLYWLLGLIIVGLIVAWVRSM